MIGYDGVAHGLADMLAEHVPTKVAALEDRDGPTVGDYDATPQYVHPMQVPTMAVGYDDWPFLLVVPFATHRMRLVDVTPQGGQVIDTTYEMRVFVWARAHGFAEVASVRGRLLLAVRMVLLQRQAPRPGWRLDMASLSESLSDIGEDEDLGGSIAAAYLTVQYVVREELEPVDEPYGSTETTEAGVGLPHDAPQQSSLAHPALM